MSEFTREMPSFRLVETHHGDDLQSIAHRELGDANRWPELIWINELTYPYITDNEDEVRPGVILSGSLLKVPAPVGHPTDDAETGQVFERDAALFHGRLEVDGNGDLAIFTGADNLRQQLEHRIVTPRGQARRHPDYGCMIWRLMGTVNGPVAGMLGAEYVKAALLADYRISEVLEADAEIVGDTVRITARARAIEGGIIDILPEARSGGDALPLTRPGYGNDYGNDWGN